MKSSERLSPEINKIFSPETIREKANLIFSRIKEGKGVFSFHEEKWEEVVSHVEKTIRENYPDLKIPFHARYVHFKAGNIDRLKMKEEFLLSLDDKERARTLIDLVITSVLLDAGAGASWSYLEKSSNTSFSRSEGLGVASFHMFFNGDFSEDSSPKATIKGLREMNEQKLREAFQVREDNPLIGEAGRVGLLKSLGDVLEENADIFPGGRPGSIVDYFLSEYGSVVPADELLKTLLIGLGKIWPSRIEKEGMNLGDVWEYAPLKAKGDEWSSLVPFHKLSQWLSYSLIEPLAEAGIKITEMKKLTGLPEYRNGGLFVDSGLIQLKEKANYEKSWKPDSELIVEWRALTICLLDECAGRVRKAMNLSEEDFPLVKVLEGGTWWAGRRLANAKRAEGNPPINIQSDGTVF